MNIGKIVLPHLHTQSKRPTGQIKKGFTASILLSQSHPQSIRPPKIQQILFLLSSLLPTCPSLQQPIRLLKYLSEKYRGFQSKQKQLFSLTSRALKAEQKINQLKLQLKKSQQKYTKDIAEIIKLKIISESTGMSRSDLMMSCNQVEIINKIENVLQREIKTFDLTEPLSCFDSQPGETEDNNKQNEENYQDLNHKEEMRSLKAKVIGLQQQLSCLRSAKRSPLNSCNDSTKGKCQRSSMKEPTRHMSVVFPTIDFRQLAKSGGNSGAVSKESNAHENQIKELKEELRKLKKSVQNYKEECLRMEEEQLFLNKVLLEKEIAQTESEEDQE